uniref:Uncharacterized protein n=1 Tax=Leptobrachium leishanense TaxID=445787 RepID=A0A8C5WKY3_9ANUR
MSDEHSLSALCVRAQRTDVLMEDTQVEKTVEHLYSEVNSLLDTLSGASWALPVIPGSSVLDIFEDGMCSFFLVICIYARSSKG